jgi:hypothetical protein
MNINVLNGDIWEQRGVLSGSGPLINETRIVSLDLRGLNCDTLTIRLNPPLGFWVIDYLAIEYNQYPAPQITDISITHSEDEWGNSVANPLASIDGTYQVMPKVGDWFKVSFNAPPLEEGLERTIFLKTSGYYEIQTDKSQPEKTALIKELTEKPGMIVEYSLEEYLKWREQQLFSK